MNTSLTLEQHGESMTVLAAKAAPPVSVSIASIAGVHVSDMVLWATLVYTTLLIIHKVYEVWKDWMDFRIRITSVLHKGVSGPIEHKQKE
jgi:hypothetical protein